jgi:hypothetical protein
LYSYKNLLLEGKIFKEIVKSLLYICKLKVGLKTLESKEKRR